MTTDLGPKRLYTGLRTTPSQARTGFISNVSWPLTTPFWIFFSFSCPNSVCLIRSRCVEQIEWAHGIFLSLLRSGHVSSVQFNLIYFQVWQGPGPSRCPSLTRLPIWETIPGPLLTTARVRPKGHRSPPLGRMISSCPNYLHVDVNDASDLSLHQQEVTGGQLASVTTNLVPGTVHSDVVSEWYRSGIGVSPLLPPPLGARQAEGL